MNKKDSIERPPHDVLLGISFVGVIRQRKNRHHREVVKKIREEFEPLLVKDHFFEDSPFHWITLIIELGEKNGEVPWYGRINKKYGDLPVTMTIHSVGSYGKADFDTTEKILKIAVLKALIHVGNKYSLKTDRLIEMLGELSSDQEALA